MADVMGAFFRGHAAGQAEQEHQQALEDNKLRTLVLKHEIDRMKIDDQIRARDLATQNLSLLHGQPAADIPSDQVAGTQPNLPSTNTAAGAMTGLPNVIANLVRNKLGAPAGGDTTAGTLSAPAAQDPMTGTNPITTRVARPVTIPGVPALGVPDTSVRPRSMEALIQAQIASKMAEPYTLAPGAVRKIGTETIGEGGPAFHAVGAGGLAATTPNGETKVVVPGRAAPSRARTVSGMLNGHRAFAIFNPDTEKYTVDGRDVTSLFTPAPSAAETSAAGRADQQAWNRDYREYRAAVQDAARQHSDAMRVWLKKRDGAFLKDGVLVDADTEAPLGATPPQYTPPSFEDWRASRRPANGTAARTPAAGRTVTQPSDPLQAADPDTGVTYQFPSKAQADRYRQARGIR
jgi:hypothetical protein